MKVKHKRKRGRKFVVRIGHDLAVFLPAVDRLWAKWDADSARSEKQRRARLQGFQMELSDWIQANTIDPEPALIYARAIDPGVQMQITLSGMGGVDVVMEVEFKDRAAAMLFKLAYC